MLLKIFNKLKSYLYFIIKKKDYFIIFILLLFPFGSILANPIAEGLIEEENNEEKINTDTWEHWSTFDRIYNICAGTILIILLCLLIYPGDPSELLNSIYEFFFPIDPLEKEWVYPQDGKVRPPQNPKQRALEDYFVIPNKPYLIDGKINFPLLNKDIIEYSKIDFEYPKGRSIPPFMVKYLEICYGYDITQEVVMNLELHRKRTASYVSMEDIYNFVKWYYRFNPYQELFTIGFSDEQLAFYEGKDYYSNRIFPKIYTRARTLPMSNE